MLGKGIGMRYRCRNGNNTGWYEKLLPDCTESGLFRNFNVPGAPPRRWGTPVKTETQYTPVPHHPLVILFPQSRISPGSSRWFPGIVYELEVEPVEVGKPAIPAPDRKIPAPDRYIMGAFHLALPA
jgi:hypothetical protein